MASNFDVLGFLETSNPEQSQSAGNPNDPLTSQNPVFGVEKFCGRYITMPEWSENDRTAELKALAEKTPYDAQVVASLNALIFEISNNFTTNSIPMGGRRSSKMRVLADILKTTAKSSSSWKSLLTGGGSTVGALVEKAFAFAVLYNDETLAKMMLQSGADPNQHIVDNVNRESLSALDVALRNQSNGLVKLLLDTGAAYGQRSLKLSVIAGNFNAADRMLSSNSFLDLNFNYIGDVDPRLFSSRRHLEVDSITLIGSVCMRTSLWDNCRCKKARLPATMKHGDSCRTSKSIAILSYLIHKGAMINLDTMIMASSCVDVIALDLLIQHGGDVSGLNRFGSSCLAAATLRDKLEVDIVSFLVSRGATINIPQTHPTFGVRESPLHSLCSRPPEMDEQQLHSIFALLLDAGVDLKYHIKLQGIPSKQVLESIEYQGDGFLEYGTPHAPEPLHSTRSRIARTGAESPLEYAIIARNEDTALQLLNRGVELTGREVTLAAQYGMLILLKKLLKHISWEHKTQQLGKTCLELALRWGHGMIVHFLLEEGVEPGDSIVHAFLGRGASKLSTKTQIKLLYMTPDLERLQICDRSLLECCFREFSEDAVRYILDRAPAAYDSGALSMAILRVLQHGEVGQDYLSSSEINALISRRTAANRDCDKENTTLLITAMFGRSDILRMLVVPDAPRLTNTAWLPRGDLKSFLGSGGLIKPYRWHMYTEPCPPMTGLHPVHEDWVKCSPLVGVAMTADRDQAADMLEYLLTCSYEPDALTVVVAVSAYRMPLLRRLERLPNWRSIVSIDNHTRPAWCPTALQVAAQTRHLDIVLLLLEAGVSVNEEPAKYTDGLGLLPRTALQAAVDRGNVNLINLFIEHGASINAPAAEDSGATALQLACMRGYLGIAQRLLDLGAQPDARGGKHHGRTALEAAAEHGRIDMIQLLLNYGVGTDGCHRTQYMKAIVRAKRNGHFTAAALLEMHRKWTAEDDECYRNLESYEWCDD